MKKSSERHLLENEAVFRDRNRTIRNSIAELDKIADIKGQETMRMDADQILSFFCECSDEDCTLRIALSVRDYNKAHNIKDQFAVKHGHEVPAIEGVLFRFKEYHIVRKFLTPPQHASKLKPTPVTNV